MEFFPLTLGRFRPKTQRDPSDRDREGGEGGRPRDHAAWREAWAEAVAGPPVEVEERRQAATLLDGWHSDRGSAAPRRTLILGEPGAGKSALLAHWHERWLAGMPAPGLGVRIPALIRLREAAAGQALLAKGESKADALWQHTADARADALNGHRAAAIARLDGRCFTPVWLLDGLDEWAGDIREPALWEAIGALPGDIVVSCRTAVFQGVAAERRRFFGEEWRVLGLQAGAEQAGFLAEARKTEGLDPARAKDLVGGMNRIDALRPLAASPMILMLLAQAGDVLQFPATRGAFYREAIRAMWSRKLNDSERNDLALVRGRNAVLEACARRLGLEAVQLHREEALDACEDWSKLYEPLKRSGLLRFTGERIEFPHLTFQEFFLARAWLREEGGFAEVLDRHWAEPRAEETLAIAASIACGELQDVEAALGSVPIASVTA